MPMRPSSAIKKHDGKRKNSGKKEKNPVQIEDIIDPRQEQIDRLIYEQEQIRSKLNKICSKIIENVNIDDYQNDIDLNHQQPSDVSLEKLLLMIDDICYFRSAFLNLIQETDDEQNLPIREKITQLSIEEPKLFRKLLTADQRVSFVARERDLWKENAQLLQTMYATIVDQLEMGRFQKSPPKTSEILQAHRLNLEDACLIFLSPSNRSLNDKQQKRRRRRPVKQIVEEEPKENIIPDVDIPVPTTPLISEEKKEEPSNLSSKVKRRVSFANKVNVIFDDEQIDNDDQSNENFRLPSASDTLIDHMDSNLRMLIIKELSKDNYIQRPLSKMSSIYGANTRQSISSQQQRHQSSEWVKFARLIGINESEIEHWLSQNLQYPAGRVLSTWCNCTSPSPTVAELHSIISSNELNRSDLVRSIETLYTV